MQRHKIIILTEDMQFWDDPRDKCSRFHIYIGEITGVNLIFDYFE